MYHHRHPRPDLPAIPEAEEAESVVGVFSPTETIPDDDNYYYGTEQKVEGEDDGVDDDDASKAESMANNSCTFSLENVGLDDESSIAGSVGGSLSIVGANNIVIDRSRGSGDGCELLSSVGTKSDGNSSLFQTPTSHERFSLDAGKSKEEHKLHRETCRTLGLPYNEDWLDTSYSSSSSDVGSGSFLGSISASSGSADEMEQRKRKIDKLWPWPTAAKRSPKKNIVEEIGLPFDEESNKNSSSSSFSKSSNVNSNSTSSSKFEASIAKISEAKSICSKNVKDAWSAFNEQMENVYGKAQLKQNSTHHLREVDLGAIESNVRLQDPDTDCRRPSYVRQFFQPAMWLNRYNESNFRTKMVFGASIIVIFLCIIVVPTTIGASRSNDDVASSSWNDYPVTSATSHSIPSDNQMTITAVAPNSLVTATIPTETSTVVTPVVSGTKPTESNTVAANSVVTSSTEYISVAPIVIPTASPVHENINLVVPSNSTTNSTTNTASPCIDMDGKFTNSNGKRRTCYWLSVRAAGEVHSTILDDECGGASNGSQISSGVEGLLKPSELGLSCRKTCRGYNGCLTSQTSGEDGGDNSHVTNSTTNSVANSTATSNGESGHNSTTAATNSSNSSTVDDSVEYDIEGGNSVKSVQGNSTSAATNSSKSSTVKEGNGTEADEVETSHSLPYFIDKHGQVRQCSFLNIRNHNRRSKRRNDNCVMETIRLTCPTYCSDFFTDTNTAVAGSTRIGGGKATEPAQQQGTAMTEATQDLVMTALSARNNDDNSSSEAKEEKGEDQDEGQPEQVLVEVDKDTITTASCLDNAGYYLNHHGRAVQCSWLIDGRDPTNESRRINNCGYGDAGSDSDGSKNQLPAVTDLGKMCKKTCGTCDSEM